MALRDKYAELLTLAQTSGVTNLNINEVNNMLYVSGVAPSEAVKNEIWKTYERLDPDMRSADIVLDIQVAASGNGVYTVQSGDNLSKIAAKYEGVSWKDIFEANKDKIKDPDKIFPGQELIIP
jgi:nucleoid-associated protein YgaU